MLYLWGKIWVSQFLWTQHYTHTQSKGQGGRGRMKLSHGLLTAMQQQGYVSFCLCHELNGKVTVSYISPCILFSKYSIIQCSYLLSFTHTHNTFTLSIRNTKMSAKRYNFHKNWQQPFERKQQINYVYGNLKCITLRVDKQSTLKVKLELP